MTGALTTAYPPASYPDPDAVVEIPVLSEPGYAGTGARSGRSGTWRVPGTAGRLTALAIRRTVPAEGRTCVLWCARTGTASAVPAGVAPTAAA